jgi:gliding motility-associated-like protein
MDNGRGAVINRAEVVMENTREAQAATHHANGKDIWLTTHEIGTDRFFSFLIGENGLDVNPVISSTGLIYAGEGRSNIIFSPQGDLAAIVYNGDGNRKVGVFRFDNVSGQFSHPIYFQDSMVSRMDIPYDGLAFSPSGRFLYVNATPGISIRNQRLFQLEIDKENHHIKDIVVIANRATVYAQLAVDGKIYMRKGSSFHIVHSPDEKGSACKLELDAFSYEKSWRRINLPQFISSYFRPCEIDLGRDTLLCEGEGLVLDARHGQGRKWIWSDGSSQPVRRITQPGTYSVHVTGRNCDARDTVTVSFRDCSLTIPNVFTPNGDGTNDTFEVDGLEKAVWSLTVHNRWGREVHASGHYLGGWDGGDLPNGTYYYHFNSESMDRDIRGWLLVMR